MVCCTNTRIVQVTGSGADGVINGGTYNPATRQLQLNTSLGGTIVITNMPADFYANDGVLSGARTIDMNGNPVTWQNGGPFIIDGKLTVTGLIDPTGLQFSGPQPDASMPNETIYISDGSASGYPSGTFVYKDSSGNYGSMGDDNSILMSVTAADVGTAAPTGAKLGYDPATGDHFYVDASGNWQQTPATPLATVDAPRIADNGAAPGSMVGTATEAARADHTHLPLEPSTDTGNTISFGTDGKYYSGTHQFMEFGVNADSNVNAAPHTLGGYVYRVQTSGITLTLKKHNYAALFSAGSYESLIVNGSGGDINIVKEAAITNYYGPSTLAAGEALRVLWNANGLNVYGFIQKQSIPTPAVSRTSAVYELALQIGHGLSLFDAVRYLNGTGWVKAQADADANTAQGIVSNVLDANTVEITTAGLINAVSPHSFTANNYYWLDQATAGAATSTQPSSGIVQPLFYVRDANNIHVMIGQPFSV